MLAKEMTGWLSHYPQLVHINDFAWLDVIDNTPLMQVTAGTTYLTPAIPTRIFYFWAKAIQALVITKIDGLAVRLSIKTKASRQCD